MVRSQPTKSPRASPKATAMPNPARVVHRVWTELFHSAPPNSTEATAMRLGAGST